MTYSVTVNDVQLVLNKNDPPIKVCVVLNFKTLSEKNRLMYALNRDKKLEYQKVYNEQNKDHYASYQKGYYEKRRDQLLAEKKEKVLCECGTTITLGNLRSHKSTNLHTKRLNAKLCMNVTNNKNDDNDNTYPANQ
jgi:hypothetical protein